MPFYTDPSLQASHFAQVQPATSFGTATAASATGCDLTGVGALPKFTKRIKVDKVRFKCTVIPDAGSTAVKANLLNGTNTFAVVTLTTATAGQWLDGVVAAANATINADVVPTINTTGTATASADAMGTYEIYFEYKFAFDPAD